MSLSGLLPLLHEQQSYKQLVNLLKEQPHGTAAWLLPTMPPAARPYFIAALQHDLNMPILVLTPRAEDAKHLHEQLLLWSNHPHSLFLYPDPDALPYERVPAGDLSARQRMAVLAHLASLGIAGKESAHPLIVVSVRALAQKTLPPKDLIANSRVLHRGHRVPLSSLLEHLLRLGYEPVTLVEEPGHLSRRGGILDIWPVTENAPVRVEFFGDNIDSLRYFDPTTQRSTHHVDAITVTPPVEVLPEYAGRAADLLTTVNIATLTPEMQKQWRDDIERLRQHIAGNQARELWQFYAPYFYNTEQPTTLLDYFDGLIVLDDAQEIAATAAVLEAQATDIKSGKVNRGELPPDILSPFVPYTDLTIALQRYPRLLLEAQTGYDHASATDTIVLTPLPFATAPVYGGRLKQALDDCQQMMVKQQRVVLTSHQAKRLSALLQEREIIAVPVEHIKQTPPPGSLTIVQGSLAEGWTLSHELILLTDVELFGWAKPRRATAQRRAALQTLLSDLAVGDYVVHIEHGVAIYGGLVKLTIEGVEREYLQLNYAQGDKLYVPVDQIDRVSRYVGIGDAPPTLTTLGSADWEYAKRRARKAVRDVARELLSIYAARQLATGTAFSPDTVWQAELEASFPYLETPDQLRAINEVKADMERPRPMDRLICGDVGYGKTEVALRAAFKAVMDGRQVAILVPTTILAQQHYNTFRERLAAFPVRVEMLSRFRSPAEQRRIIKELREGTIDICIGTHRLIQKDVSFKNLGLVIIDEEQRFGVMHKEQLKKLRREVDVLTLSATPIPRTLHMSLVGVRDMSIIDTPPEDRLPITTIVAPYDENLIKQAILRELDRGGQVYFVHNRVQSIEHVARRLQSLLPNVSFAIGHGQMPEEELERVMLDFVAGKIDVLVCTAIIESGVDIPNVNTIIIDHADQFGLAQLYQLRGRVGRGANRAYAYLLHDRSFQMTETAEQRLKAIFEASSLGAGYRIALKDLEIRGAGNLLGVEQHGHIAAVGFDLYTRLLAAEVERLKQEGWTAEEEERDITADLLPSHPSVVLPIPAFIPVSYIEDELTRLAIYQRMANVTNAHEVEDMRQELRDRFGPLPASVENLLYVLNVRARASAAGVTAITGHDHEITLTMQDGKTIMADVLKRQFGSELKIGTYSIRLDRRRVGSRWRERLLVLLDALS